MGFALSCSIPNTEKIKFVFYRGQVFVLQFLLKLEIELIALRNALVVGQKPQYWWFLSGQPPAADNRTGADNTFPVYFMNYNRSLILSLAFFVFF
jgi:hypothetical protein